MPGDRTQGTGPETRCAGSGFSFVRTTRWPVKRDRYGPIHAWRGSTVASITHPRMPWFSPAASQSMRGGHPFGTPLVDPRHAWMLCAGTAPTKKGRGASAPSPQVPPPEKWVSCVVRNTPHAAAAAVHCPAPSPHPGPAQPPAASCPPAADGSPLRPTG